MGGSLAMNGTLIDVDSLQPQSSPWDYLRAHVTDILRDSPDPAIRELWRRRRGDIAGWYEGYDYFASALMESTGTCVDNAPPGGRWKNIRDGSILKALLRQGPPGSVITQEQFEEAKSAAAEASVQPESKPLPRAS